MLTEKHTGRRNDVRKEFDRRVDSKRENVFGRELDNRRDDRRRADLDHNNRDRSRERNNQYGARSRSRERNNDYSSRGRFVLLRETLKDENLPHIDDDPRIDKERGVKVVKIKGKGMNTESFDPKSTLVRPDMRIILGPKQDVYGKSVKHDDVIVVPNFFCEESDWSIYYKLLQEMRDIQSNGEDKSEWISWAEGAHLITNNPTSSPTFQDIQTRIAKYFGIEMKSVGTRFNWYRDSSDWKPFHHDSAAFNPHRASNQNITVGVSFGATRELAFLHAKHGTKVYFPQTNGMLFSFGRDTNILWKHGINALPEEEQHGKGRISIILWGLVPDVIEEADSPPMIVNNPHERNRRPGDEICRDFLKGRCRYGSSCRFSHRA